MVTLTVNGVAREVDVPDDVPLLWVLREELGLTGTKFGCGMAICGACTVHVDGAMKRSCVVAVGDVAGRSVVTIEGLTGETADALRRAWIAASAPQCGYCQPGQIMSAAALLKKVPRPTDDDIDAVLSANLCRCGTYQRIRRAVHLAAEQLTPDAAAPRPTPSAGEPGGDAP